MDITFRDENRSVVDIVSVAGPNTRSAIDRFYEWLDSMADKYATAEWVSNSGYTSDLDDWTEIKEYNLKTKATAFYRRRS